MKIIFLDWTGVLFTYTSGMHCTGMKNRADSRCVDALNFLVEHTGAEIVVCSEFRIHFGLKQINEYMKLWGVHKRARNTTGTQWDKAKSIQEFLKDCRNVKSYVILDDELHLDINLDYRDLDGKFIVPWAEGIQQRIITTKEENGLTMRDVRKAMTMLTI